MKVFIVWCNDDGILAVCDSKEKATAKAEWYDGNGYYYIEDIIITEKEVE